MEAVIIDFIPGKGVDVFEFTDFNMWLTLNVLLFALITLKMSKFAYIVAEFMVIEIPRCHF